MSNNNMDDAVIPLMPIWDTINDLDRLRGIADMMATLTGPCCLKEDHEYEIFNDYFMDISDRLAAAYTTLTTAREKVIFLKQPPSKPAEAVS